MDDERERMRHRDWRPVAVGAAVVVLALAGGAWGLGAFGRESVGGLPGHGSGTTPGPGPVTSDAAINGDTYVLLDNRTLQVQVVVGVGCEETGKAAGVVDDGPGKVQIHATVTRPARTSPPPEVCTANAILQDVVVRLADSLDARQVIDGVRHQVLRLAPREQPSVNGPDIAAPRAEQLDRTDEFGIITAISGGLRISVDRVQMLSPETTADSPAYTIRNDSAKLRNYRVAPDAVVWGSIQMGLPEPWPQRATLMRWRAFVVAHLGQQHQLWHFTVEDGVVTGIEEQYLP
jgi:hypothetical protein